MKQQLFSQREGTLIIVEVYDNNICYDKYMYCRWWIGSCLFLPTCQIDCLHRLIGRGVFMNIILTTLWKGVCVNMKYLCIQIIKT